MNNTFAFGFSEPRVAEDKGIGPFFIAGVAILALIPAVPEIIPLLPSLMVN